jgi:adenine-specific DNA-methyltransferase
MKSIKQAILRYVPLDGSQIGNQSLMKQLRESGLDISDEQYDAAKGQLIAEGVIAKGRGRGGAVYRIDVTDFDLSPQQEPTEKPAGKKKVSVNKQTAGRKKQGDSSEVLSYRYDDKRTNNPHVGMVDTHSDGVEEQKTWAYDPHIDPALNFDSARAQVETLIDDALASGDAAQMQAALEQLKRMQSPYLNWSGKAERTSFEVDTVSLHVHERLDPATILAAVQKRIKDSKGKASAAFQPDMFHAPFENLPLREAIDFYKHERDWANRLIAGDSLLVMNSLLQKESMAGQVQMIYIDPPYGIKYGSNFQPFVNKRDVKDRKDEDLTQEPEMIKAFRDTWELGIHSYLTYLRDRLLLAKELLSESGSVFVQISDENVHLIRNMLDETFGVENFVSEIFYTKTSGFGDTVTLATVGDYLIWYAKDKTKIKYRQLFTAKDDYSPQAKDYKWIENSHGSRRSMTTEEQQSPKLIPSNSRRFSLTATTSQGATEAGGFDIEFVSKKFSISGDQHWKTSRAGMTRLSHSTRLHARANSLRFVRYLNDFPVVPIANHWPDLRWGFDAGEKRYVVETNPGAIERCMLMATDPGDLVLDPTCGSGTTAFVAEKLGRRWITTDTSRVAVTLAKQRLMTASYDYYELKYPQEGLKGGFIYKTVPHVTLKSIANNSEIDEIYERMHPAIKAALAALNKSLVSRLRGNDGLKEWDVPFDFPDQGDKAWPEAARKAFDAFHTARQAMRKKMDESIAAHAGQEVLHDQPTVSKNKLRITGPFTVEAVPFATVLGLDEAEQPKEADVAVARSGATSRQSQWRDELLKAGIRGKGGQKIQLLDLAPLPGAKYIHAIGTVKETGDKVAVSFGPEHAALEQRQVEIAMREAGELFPLPKMLVFCAFTFDPEAAKDIDNIKGITALKVQMNTDLLTEDLKKGRASNESFWLMGQPDVSVKQLKDGQYQVEVKGFDYFDTKTGELRSGGKKNIAMWALDTDYDNRSLFPRQVFFPMAGSKDGWNKLRRDIRAELNEDLLDKFHGTLSLPFSSGENECIAVKIVDDRGIESLKVINLDKA